MNKWKCQKFLMQEYIPVGCIPSAATVVSLAMHAPHHTSLPVMHAYPAMHTPCHALPPETQAPCHTCPLPHKPPAMHAPCHTSPLPHMPPATHAPCHTCPPCHAFPPPGILPPVDRLLDRCLWNITFPELLLQMVITWQDRLSYEGPDRGHWTEKTTRVQKEDVDFG